MILKWNAIRAPSNEKFTSWCASFRPGGIDYIYIIEKEDGYEAEYVNVENGEIQFLASCGSLAAAKRWVAINMHKIKRMRGETYGKKRTFGSY